MTEDKVEQNALEILASLGWQVLRGPEIGPDGTGERAYTDAALSGRLEQAIARLNPNISEQTQAEAVKRILRTSEPTLLLDNREFHNLLVNGVDVEYRNENGDIRGDKVWQ